MRHEPGMRISEVLRNLAADQAARGHQRGASFGANGFDGGGGGHGGVGPSGRRGSGGGVGERGHAVDTSVLTFCNRVWRWGREGTRLVTGFYPGFWGFLWVFGPVGIGSLSMI